MLTWDSKIFSAQLIVENSSFIINVSFFVCRHCVLPEIITKITIYSYEIRKIKSDPVNKFGVSGQQYSVVLRNEIVNFAVVLLHKLLLICQQLTLS